MKRLSVALVSAALFAAAAPAFAHHSGAMYEPQKAMTLSGIVTNWDWKNPHAHVEIMLMDGTSWGVECSTPNILARKGWANTTFAPGDKVTTTLRPMKDGSKEGYMLTITTAKGVILKDHDD
jgi:hypothetical protein